jgi:hypothetical protein
MYTLSNPQVTSFPGIPGDLLEALDERFPERCPDPAWDERRIWREVGAREVVRYLKAIHEEQTRDILNTNDDPGG